MSKKQSRRSVSIRGSTYEQIRQYCENNGVSMSEFVEERIATFFGNGDVPEIKPSTNTNERIKPDDLYNASRYFTF